MNTKKEEIYEMLKFAYREDNVPDEDLRYFAEELYDHVFVYKGSFVEVMMMVNFFENDLSDEGIIIDIPNECYIFTQMVNMLDENSENAERLYETFLEFNDFDVFELLMTTYSEWLTEDQIREIKEIAMGFFDKTLIKPYI